MKQKVINSTSKEERVASHLYMYLVLSIYSLPPLNPYTFPLSAFPLPKHSLVRIPSGHSNDHQSLAVRQRLRHRHEPSGPEHLSQLLVHRVPSAHQLWTVGLQRVVQLQLFFGPLQAELGPPQEVEQEAIVSATAEVRLLRQPVAQVLDVGGATLGHLEELLAGLGEDRVREGALVGRAAMGQYRFPGHGDAECGEEKTVTGHHRCASRYQRRVISLRRPPGVPLQTLQPSLAGW